MLVRLFYILFFAMLLCGVGGFVLNNTEAGPQDLYKSMVGGQGMVDSGSSAQQTVKANRETSRDYFANIRAQQDRLRDQMRNLQAKLLGSRNADKARRQEMDNKLSTLNQKNEDSIRRQQDRMRDLQQLSRNRMSSSRNQR